MYFVLFCNMFVFGSEINLKLKTVGSGISDTQVWVSRPRLRFWKPWSQGRDRYRDFFYTSLNVETETETINFETETETQMEVVETIKDETREICLRLQFSKLSRPRLFETMEISGCRDWDQARLVKSCRDRDFFESLADPWES